MKIVNVIIDGQERFGIEKNGSIHVIPEDVAVEYGIPLNLEALFQRDNVIDFVYELQSVFHHCEDRVQTFSAQDVTFMAPVPRGKKIICVGLNYKKHAEESEMALPSVPLIFSKFDNTLTGHNAVVKMPPSTSQMDYEAEVCLVIGRSASNVSEETALDYVLGYTLANDLSARDMQFVTSQWLLGKTYDGFCPIGPAVLTADEIDDVNQIHLRCLVNGEVRQDATTQLMIFPFTTLISYISSHITLEPGDVILSGTPDGVALGMPEGERKWLQPGDEVIVEAGQLGRLNTIIG